MAICQQIGDEEGKGMVYANMGNLYIMLNQYEVAMECYEKDLAICQQTGDEEGNSRAYGNMGNLYSRLGQKEKAKGVF